MNDEFDHDADETQSAQPAPPPLPATQIPDQNEIAARERLEAIRIELSKVNTTANRTPDAFVSWLRSKL